jgi:CubicO group peptidase (beta-lactamase class C family)
MMLGGNGCIVKDGYLIKTWGSCSARRDWYSSAKPIFSTLLFFAIEEDRVSGVDERIGRWGWELRGKDQGITFRHLADMTSNYMQPQAPGETFDYNDYAIALYVATLRKVFGESVSDAARKRLYMPLQMQDGPYNQTDPQPRAPRGRAWLSVRDFARLCWFWMNRGNWAGKQLLPEFYFEKYMKPDTLPNLAYSDTVVKVKRPADSNPGNYLHIPTFGGGTNQHRDYGAGIYGFNWWFNAQGTLGPAHSRTGQSFRQTWPGVPPDTVMTSGYGGNHSVMIPSLGIMLVSGGGKWKKPTMDPGNSDYFNNRIIKLLADSVVR